MLHRRGEAAKAGYSALRSGEYFETRFLGQVRPNPRHGLRFATLLDETSGNNYHPVDDSSKESESHDDAITQRFSLAVRRRLDRLADGLSADLPSPVEVEADHRH